MTPPPIWNYPLSVARLAIRENIHPEAAYEVMSSLGANVPKERWDRLYGQALKSANMVGASSHWPLDQIPTSDIIQDLTTVTSTGYLYQTSVSVVDKSTGLERQIPWSLRTDDLLLPQEVVDSALVSQRIRAKQYEFEVLDAEITGFYRLVPEDG